MNQHQQSGADEQPAVSMRTMEIVVALMIMVLGAIVVYDSHRLGSSWGDDGPQSGYFPFYIGLLLCLSSVGTLVETLLEKGGDGEAFVTREKLKLVLTVLFPALLYVAGVQYIGLYLASAIYIAFFMVWLGKYSWVKSAAIALGVTVSLFLMFEVWFKVPLFKGTLDPLSFLGY
ncbi:MAG: tripartite tricarboxylate transporter TctB family protein [Casimicrobiaceae bacterium]